MKEEEWHSRASHFAANRPVVEESGEHVTSLDSTAMQAWLNDNRPTKEAIGIIAWHSSAKGLSLTTVIP